MNVKDQPNSVQLPFLERIGDTFYFNPHVLGDGGIATFEVYVEDRVYTPDWGYDENYVTPDGPGAITVLFDSGMLSGLPAEFAADAWINGELFTPPPAPNRTPRFTLTNLLGRSQVILRVDIEGFVGGVSEGVPT